MNTQKPIDKITIKEKPPIVAKAIGTPSKVEILAKIKGNQFDKAVKVGSGTSGRGSNAANASHHDIS